MTAAARVTGKTLSCSQRTPFNVFSIFVLLDQWLKFRQEPPWLQIIFSSLVDAMTKAVYYKLWASTANWTQRSNYGVVSLCPMDFLCGRANCCLVDEWKKVLTLGIYEPPAIHWDYCMTGMRSDFVKYHAQYPGIPYK
eukprot:s2357_g3.t1